MENVTRYKVKGAWINPPFVEPVEEEMVLAADYDRDVGELNERINQLEVSMVGHFQREHLEGDVPEIGRWKMKHAEQAREIKRLKAKLEER